MLRLALGLLLLVVCSVSSRAVPNTDDRYFDSRGAAASQKATKHRAKRKHVVRARKAVRAARKEVRHTPRFRHRKIVWQHHRAALGQPVEGWTPVTTRAATVVGGRPAGCPHAFCGCGASLRIFGRIIPMLNLAANWLRFPKSHPAPGMVAVRRHHVFVLEQHLGGNVWMAHDSNSGGHKTRIHARSISGYVVVNPRSG
jgi:hypothetical protein